MGVEGFIPGLLRNGSEGSVSPLPCGELQLPLLSPEPGTVLSDGDFP